MVEGSFQKGDHGIRSLGIERMVLLVREPRVFSLHWVSQCGVQNREKLLKTLSTAFPVTFRTILTSHAPFRNGHPRKQVTA